MITLKQKLHYLGKWKRDAGLQMQGSYDYNVQQEAAEQYANADLLIQFYTKLTKTGYTGVASAMEAAKAGRAAIYMPLVKTFSKGGLMMLDALTDQQIEIENSTTATGMDLILIKELIADITAIRTAQFESCTKFLRFIETGKVSMPSNLFAET